MTDITFKQYYDTIDPQGTHNLQWDNYALNISERLPGEPSVCVTQGPSRDLFKSNTRPKIMRNLT